MAYEFEVPPPEPPKKPEPPKPKWEAESNGEEGIVIIAFAIVIGFIGIFIDMYLKY